MSPRSPRGNSSTSKLPAVRPRKPSTSRSNPPPPCTQVPIDTKRSPSSATSASEADVAELGDLFVSIGTWVNGGGGFERDVDGFRGRTAGSFEVDEFPRGERGDIVGQHSGEVEVEVFTLFRADRTTGGQLAESGDGSEHPLSSFPPCGGRAGNGAHPRFGYSQHNMRTRIDWTGGQSVGAWGAFKVSRLRTGSDQAATARKAPIF